MKKIYSFTLDSDEYPSEKFSSNLRLFAYLMYDKLYNYDVDGFIPLNINKNIVYNRIDNSYDGSQYYMDSDMYDNGSINYEPFIIGKKSFGLTIDDDTIDDVVLNKLMKEVFTLLKVNYKVNIDSITYYSKNRDDESHRRKAVSILYNRLGYEMPFRKFGFSRKKVLKNTVLLKPISMFGR